MKTRFKLFIKTQSYNNDFSGYEAMVNDWIWRLEESGAEIMDIRHKIEAADRFSAILLSIMVLYLAPDDEGYIEPKVKTEQRGRKRC